MVMYIISITQTNIIIIQSTLTAINYIAFVVLGPSDVQQTKERWRP